jgi:hypothetical protein
LQNLARNSTRFCSWERVKVKDRIDWIASKMMDETKIYEKMNFKKYK